MRRPAPASTMPIRIRINPADLRAPPATARMPGQALRGAWRGSNRGGLSARPGFATFLNMAAMISIQVNGETREVPAPTTVADLLARIGLDARKVAVERNLEIVPRSTYATTALAAGDRLEIVHFIGGG